MTEETPILISEDAAEGAETFDDFFNVIESQMMDYVKKSYKVPETNWEQFQAFLAAVNWNEKLIIGLICLHLTLLLIFILFRRNLDVQMVLFLCISVLVYFSENVNRWGAANWRDFATQNYFDKSGVFLGIFYASPMLLIATAQLINVLIISSSTLIKVKRAELRRKYQLNKEAKNDGSVSVPGATGSDSANNACASSETSSAVTTKKNN